METGRKRQLAAIMFTDIVGYTAMMQENEGIAMQKRERYKKVLEEQIHQYEGKILQFYGDGTLSIFSSAINAVESAVKIQQAFQKDPQVPLRIGIHSGDILYDDEGIYGDGVNIASRIQSQGVAGSILVSDKIFDDIKNHDIKNILLGSFNLKNVKQPIKIYAIDAPEIIVPDSSTIVPENLTDKSIAVLPFVNMSSDPDNEYFSDGITEELLNCLVKEQGLKVTSRTSSFAFKNKNYDIKEIGKQLNVNYILEGSVRKAGQRVRITTQLICITDGFHLWSETFDRNLEDIFEIQDEISMIITNKLREKFSLGKKEKIRKRPTENMEAYKLYLKGRFHANKQTPEDYLKAIEFFNKAVELEPDFAQAYAQKAYVYFMLGARNQILPKTGFAKGKEAALKAIDLDDTIADSYIALAMINHFVEKDVAKAEKNLLKAIDLKPGSAFIHQTYGMFLHFTGRTERGIEQLELAYELDPLSLSLMNDLGFIYLTYGRIEEGMAMIDKVLEMDKEYRAAYENKGWGFTMQEKYAEALEAFELYYSKVEDQNKGLAGLGYVNAKLGNTEVVNELVNKLNNRVQQQDFSAIPDLSIIYLGSKDWKNLFENLKLATDANLSGMIFMRYFPEFKELKQQPQFQQYWDKFKMSDMYVEEEEKVFINN